MAFQVTPPSVLLYRPSLRPPPPRSVRAAPISTRRSVERVAIPGIDRQHSEWRKIGNGAPRQASIGAAQNAIGPGRCNVSIEGRWRRRADREHTKQSTHPEPVSASVGALEGPAFSTSSATESGEISVN